jgi:hypothetical protein
MFREFVYASGKLIADRIDFERISPQIPTLVNVVKSPRALEFAREKRAASPNLQANL